MQTLADEIRPLLQGAVSLSDLDEHTRQALTIFIHFRASALIDLPTDQIKQEIEKTPESVRELLRAECRRLYCIRRKGNNGGD